MSKIWYKMKSWFLTRFGNIKIFKYPFWIVYDPFYYKMTGQKMMDLMKILQPGDVILRGYDGYLDSYFITSSRSYSHAGIYIGNGQMVHAVAPNVCYVNVIEFCECDRIAVVRPVKGQRKAIQIARRFARENVPYDFNYTHGKETLYCFELAACCYPSLQIEKLGASIFGGLIKKKEKVVLSDSFFNSKDFRLIFEYNPKYNIDFNFKM